MRERRFDMYLHLLILILAEIIFMSHDGEGTNSTDEIQPWTLKNKSGSEEIIETPNKYDKFKRENTYKEISSTRRNNNKEKRINLKRFDKSALDKDQLKMKSDVNIKKLKWKNNQQRKCNVVPISNDKVNILNNKDEKNIQRSNFYPDNEIIDNPSYSEENLLNSEQQLFTQNNDKQQQSVINQLSDIFKPMFVQTKSNFISNNEKINFNNNNHQGDNPEKLFDSQSSTDAAAAANWELIITGLRNLLYPEGIRDINNSNNYSPKIRNLKKLYHKFDEVLESFLNLLLPNKLETTTPSYNEIDNFDDKNPFKEIVYTHESSFPNYDQTIDQNNYIDDKIDNDDFTNYFKPKNNQQKQLKENFVTFDPFLSMSNYPNSFKTGNNNQRIRQFGISNTANSFIPISRYSKSLSQFSKKKDNYLNSSLNPKESFVKKLNPSRELFGKRSSYSKVIKNHRKASKSFDNKNLFGPKVDSQRNFDKIKKVPQSFRLRENNLNSNGIRTADNNSSKISDSQSKVKNLFLKKSQSNFYSPKTKSNQEIRQKREINDCKNIPSDYYHVSGNSYAYKIHTHNLTWMEAQLKCKNESAQLALPKNQIQYNLMIEYAQRTTNDTDSNFYIGFHRLFPSKTWTTISGDILPFERWADVTMNNEIINKQCGSLIGFKIGKTGFVGKSCTLLLPFICEIKISSNCV